MERILEVELMDTEEEAREYDAMDHTEANSAFVERLLEIGGGSGRMVDIGCGPAHLPLLVAARAPGAVVMALEPAAWMVAAARRRRREARAGSRVVLLRGSGRNLPLRDASADAVLCNSVVHHLADPVPLLREAARVLRPGGVLLFRDLLRPPTHEEAHRLVALHAAGAGERQRQLFFDSLRAAFTMEEMEGVVRAADLGHGRLWRSSDRHWTLEIPRGAA